MKSVIEKQVGPNWMVYDADDDAVHVLNPTARMIYEMHREGMGVAAIAEALRSHFQVPPEKVLATDIEKVIQDLSARGLL